jgi:general secretion pathway protein H
MKFSSEKGFTLAEILVVIILLALAGSLVFTSVGKSMADKQNKAFARDMVSLCKKARRMAVDAGVPTGLNISSTNRRCWIDNSSKSLGIPSQMLIEGKGIPQLNEALYTIRFYPDGSSDGGELTLSVSGQTVYAFRVDMLTGILSRIEEDV